MDTQKILAQASTLQDKMTALRHELHEYPEMGWHEVRTTDVIERELRAIGITAIRRGFAGTTCGIVCDINPDATGSGVAIRADIDGLAVNHEDNDLPYATKNPGVMHACGHDAHAAALLGAAKIFFDMKDQLPGRVRLMFQPSEEQAPTPGAKSFIKEGALEGIDFVVGFHVRAGAPEGQISVCPGPATTSGDIWELDVIGKGGHGSSPQDCFDPTLCAAHIVCALQSIVSREIDPGERVVVSVGTLKSGSAVNVIPDKCEITGNIRTTSPDVRATIPERIERIAGGVAAAMRCRTEFRFIPVYPSIINNLELCDVLRDTTVELFGTDKFKIVPISSGSDDFNFYSTERPSVYFNIGMGDGGTPYCAPHHSPQFRTNDAILKNAAAELVALACNILAGKK